MPSAQRGALAPPARIVWAIPLRLHWAITMRSRAGKVRLKSSEAQLLASGILVEDSAAERPMSLAKIFGNARPVEVEVGSGKGGFLLSRAAARPALNLLGIEWVRKYAYYAADRARRASLSNVRLLCADAEAVFRVGLPAASVCRVHVYFPDPWPKRRHLARRLIKPPFLADVHRALRLGGQVAILTDHADYFRQIRWVFSGQPGLAEIRFTGKHAPAPDITGTNFARKYGLAGRQLHAITAIRWA